MEALEASDLDILSKQRGQYLTENFKASGSTLKDSLSENYQILQLLLQYLDKGFHGTAIPDNIAFLIEDLKNLFDQNELTLQAGAVNLDIINSVHGLIATAFHHPEPVVQAWFLYLLCSSSIMMDVITMYSNPIDVQALLGDLLAIATSNPLRWNQLRAIDMLNIIIVKMKDSQAASLFCDLIFNGIKNGIDHFKTYDALYSRLILSLGYLLDTPSESILSKLDDCAALIFDGLHSDSSDIQLASLHVLIRSLANVYGTKATSMFLDRVTELSKSSNSMVQSAAIQFLGRFLTEKKPSLSAKSKLKSILQMISSLNKLPGKRRNVAIDLLRESFKLSLRQCLENRNYRNRFVRDLLRIPQTYARLNRIDSSGTLFKCSNANMISTTEIEFNFAADSATPITITIGRRIPYLQGVPDGCTSIPICIEPDRPLHDVTDLVRFNDIAMNDVPPCFSRSLNSETDSIPDGMTAVIPTPLMSDAPFGFRHVQIMKGDVAPGWTPIETAGNNPRTIPNFDAMPAETEAPSRRQDDDFPLYSEISFEIDLSYPTEVITSNYVSGSQANLFEPRMWLGKIVEVVTLSDTDTAPLETIRAFKKDDMVHFRARGKNGNWKEYAVQIYRELPVWSFDTAETSCAETVIPAGIDKNGKLLFYPAVNFPQLPVKHEEDGNAVYEGKLTYLPVPYSYTKAGQPYFAIKGPANSDSQRARLCGFTNSGMPILCSMTALVPKPSGFTNAGIPFYSASWILYFLQLCSDNLCTIGDVQVDLYPNWESKSLEVQETKKLSLENVNEIFQFSFSSNELFFCSTTRPQSIKLTLEVIARPSISPVLDFVDIMVFASPYEIFNCSPNQCRATVGQPITLTITFSPMFCEAKSCYINGYLELLNSEGTRCGQAQLIAFCGPWVNLQAQNLARTWCEVGRSRVVQMLLENMTSKDIFCKLAIHQSSEFVLEDDEIMIGPLSNENFKIEFSPKDSGQRHAILSVNSDEHDEQLFELVSYGGSQMVFEMPALPESSVQETLSEEKETTEVSLKMPSPTISPEIVLSTSSPKEIHAFRKQLLKENRAAKLKAKVDAVSRASSNNSKRMNENEGKSVSASGREVLKFTQPKTTQIELTRSGADMLRVDFGILQRGKIYEKSFAIKNRMMSESIIFTDFLSSRMFSCNTNWHEVAGNENVSINITAEVPETEPIGVITEDVNVLWPDCCNSHIAVSAFIGCPLEASLSPFAFFCPSAIGEIAKMNVIVRNLSSYKLRWRFEFAEMDDDAGFFFTGSRLEDSLEAAKRETFNQSIEPFESSVVTIGFIAATLGAAHCRMQIQIKISDDDNILSSDAGAGGSIIRLVGIGIDSGGLNSDQVESLRLWMESNRDVSKPGETLSSLTLNHLSLPSFSSKEFNSIVFDVSMIQIVTSTVGDRMKSTVSITVKLHHGIFNSANSTVLVTNGASAKFSANSQLQIEIDLPLCNYVIVGYLCVIDNDSGSVSSIPMEIYPSIPIIIYPSKLLDFGSSFVSSMRSRRFMVMNFGPQALQYTAALKQSASNFCLETAEQGDVASFQTLIMSLSHFSSNPGDEDAVLEILFKLPKTGQQFIVRVDMKSTIILPLESATVNSVDFGCVPTGFQALVKLTFANNSIIDQCVYISSQLPFTPHHKMILIPKHTSGIVLLMYRPMKSGLHSKFFYIKSSEKLIQIAARGQAGTLNLSLTNVQSDQIDFGVQQTGTISMKYVMLTNTGTLPCLVPGVGQEQLSHHAYFIVKAVGVVRRTSTVPTSKTIRNPVHVLRKRYRDAIHLLNMLRGNEAGTLQQQPYLTTSDESEENATLIPPLHALLFRLGFSANRQGTHTTEIPVEYTQGRSRYVSSNSLIVQYLSAEVDVENKNPVEVLNECWSDIPPRKIQLKLRGSGLGRILITTNFLDFGVVPSGKKQTQKIPLLIPSKHTAGSNSNSSDLASNNIKMLTLINASFTQQSVSIVQVSNKFFTVKMGNWNISPGAELSIPVTFSPNNADAVSTGFVIIRHSFGDESVQLKGIGGDVRLRFVGSCPPLRATAGVEVTQQVSIENRGLLRGQVRAFCHHTGPFGLLDLNGNRTRDFSFMMERESTRLLTVTFQSNEFDLMQSVLTLSWEPTPGTYKEIQLQLAGKVGVAKLVSKTKKLKFAVVLVHMAFKKELQLMNNGDSTCHWKCRRTDNIWTVPESGEIAPDGSADVTVWVKFHEVQNVSTSVVFRSDGGTLTIPLTAFITVPQLTIEGPLKVDLGVIRCNQMASHQLKLHNAGRNSIVVLISFGDTSSESLHTEAAAILHALSSLSNGDITDDKRIEFESVYGKTTQSLSIEGFTVRDWFRQMEPDQTSLVDIVATPLIARKNYLTTVFVTSGLISGTDYIPMESISGSVSCTGGSADLQLVVHEEQALANQTGLTTWTDDARINSILHGDHDPSGPITVSFGLVLVESVCVNDWSLSIVNRGNMECDFEIIDDSNCIDNDSFSAAIFSFKPDGGRLLIDQMQSISIRASPTKRGLFQRQMTIVSPTWKTCFPICIRVIAEDRLLECETASLDFGRRQTGIVHSLPLKLSSTGRFSFDYRCSIDENLAAVSEYQTSLEQKKYQAVLNGHSIPEECLATPPTSSNNPFSIVNPKGSVSSGSSTTIEVQFRPGQAWLDWPALFLITISWSGTSFLVPVSGRAGSAQLQLKYPSPSKKLLDFGNVLITEKYWGQVQCLNTGSLPMDFRLSCSDSTSIRLDDNLKAVHAIEAGSCKQIGIGLVLNHRGSFEGTVEIQSDVGVYYIPIKAYGCKLEFLVDEDVAFGEVPINRTTQHSLILSNTGDIQASFELSFSRPEEIHTAFSFCFENQDRSSLVVDVGCGDSVEINVKFCSSVPISFQNDFIVVQPTVLKHKQTVKKIPLSASACIMSLTVDNGTDLDLGYVTIGDSLSISRRIFNNTNNALRYEWQIQERSCSEADLCWQVSPLHGNIEPNGEQTLEITFKALNVVMADACQEVDLILRNQTVDSIDAKINLKASVGIPLLNVILGHGSVSRADCIQFGKYRVGGRPGYCALEVNNLGHGRLDYSISLSNSDSEIPSPFALTDSERHPLVFPIHPEPLPGLSSATYFVRFRPESPGDFSSLITVSTLNPSTSFPINVSGAASTFAFSCIPRILDMGCINLGGNRSYPMEIQNSCSDVHPIRFSFDQSSARYLSHLPDDAGQDDSEDPNNSFDNGLGDECISGHCNQGVLLELSNPFVVLPSMAAYQGPAPTITVHASINTGSLVESLKDTLALLCPTEEITYPLPVYSKPIPGSKLLFMNSLANGCDQIQIQYSINVKSLQLTSAYITFEETLVGRPVVERVSITNDAEFSLPFQLVASDSRLTCSPDSGVIPSHGEVEITLTFYSLSPFDSDSELQQRGTVLEVVCTSDAALFDPIQINCNVKCRDYCFNAADLVPIKFSPMSIGLSVMETQPLKLTSVASVPVKCHLEWDRPNSPFDLPPDSVDNELEFQPKETKIVQIRFHAKEPGTFSYILHLKTAMGTFDLPVSGEAFYPHVKLSQNKIDFGVVAQEYPVERSIILTNPCPIPFTISCPVTHPEFSLFFQNVEADKPLVLEPGHFATVRVVFSPKLKKKTKSASAADHCTFKFCQECWSEPLAELLCVGRSGLMQLDFSKGALKLGHVPHQHTEQSSFSIKNTGTVPVHCCIMEMESNQPVDTINFDSGWIKFRPHDFHISPDEEITISLLILANKEGSINFSFRVGLLNSLREKFWHMQIHLYGDKIILSSQSQSLLNNNDMDFIGYVEISDNQHLLDVLAFDDRVHMVSIHHHLAMIDPSSHDSEISLAAALARPAAIAPEIISTLRRWYMLRQPLRLTHSPTPMATEHIERLEEMLAPVNQRRHSSQNR